MKGILVDEELNVINAGDRDVGIITNDDILVTPPYEESLTGITLNRILELLETVICVCLMGIAVCSVDRGHDHHDQGETVEAVFCCRGTDGQGGLCHTSHHSCHGDC